MSDVQNVREKIAFNTKILARSSRYRYQIHSLFEKHCNQRLNYAFIYKIKKYVRINDVLIKILKIRYHTIKVSFYKACVKDER